MLKSINGWTFAETISIAEMARQARAAGFEAIEPVLTDSGALRIDSDEATLRAAGETIHNAGLDVAGLATGAFWQFNYTSPDPDDRHRAEEITKALLERARWIGAPAVLVVPGCVGTWDEKTPRVGYAEALALAAQSLERLAPAAEQFGVTIAIENVWNRFLLSPVEMREMIDRINSPWVGAYFDVGNVLRDGFPCDWIEILGKRIARVHVKDFQLAVGTLDGFCQLGDGDVDWPSVMAAFRRIGYTGPLTYEGPGELADIAARLSRILSRDGG
jgi:L-ribulose-5-phosphate 3-epimerase